MARKRVNTTKYEIIQTATRLFLEKGYSATTPRHICDELDISTGNLTYYFPTKEHLLAELVKMLCNYQGKIIQSMVQEEGITSLLALCVELATMVAISEVDEIAKDLFLSAYSSTMCLDIIREHDTKRSRQIYQKFCPDWDELNYVEAEVLVSGIEYATLTTSSDTLPLEVRISCALNNIMLIYHVPEELRQDKITKVLSADYQTLGRQILEQFKEFVNQTNEQTMNELLGGTHFPASQAIHS